MTSADPALLREALLRLRDPLARIAISLGAGELGLRADGAERVAEIAQSALAEADERIEELLQALEGCGPRSLNGDARGAVALACARAHAAARARGVRFEYTTASAACQGDPREFRLATLRLLRIAFAWAGRDATVRLALAVDASAHNVLICEGERAQPCAQAAALRDRSVRFALVSGARVSGLDSLATARLALRAELP